MNKQDRVQRRITVVVPIYNERDHIESLLNWLVESLPPGARAYLVDGDSTDGTVEILRQWAARYPDRLVVRTNPKRYVPFAINQVVREVKPDIEDIIIRLDAHTDYAPDYFEAILEVMERTGADIVGGPQRKRATSPWQQAIARATSSPFGVGDSHIHFEYEGEADTVYLGAWKGKVFQTIGLLDESLPCNEDEEFHYRARRAGLRIVQSPRIRAWYYPRKSLAALFRQYFRYGYYKPEVIFCKVRGQGHWRHLVPPAFVLYLVLLPVLGVWMGWVGVLPLMLYLLLDVFFSWRYGKGWGERWRLLLVYPTLHIAYGLGFLLGVSRWWRCIRRRRRK